MVKRLNKPSMMTSGNPLLSPSMQSIMSMLEDTLMINVVIMVNHYLKVVLLEPNAIHNSSFLIKLNLIVNHKTHLKKVFHFVHLKISLTKSSIPFNGLETFSKVFLLMDLLNVLNIYRTHKNICKKLLKSLNHNLEFWDLD